jgi:hypothetical protein
MLYVTLKKVLRKTAEETLVFEQNLLTKNIIIKKEYISKRYQLKAFEAESLN